MLQKSMFFSNVEHTTLGIYKLSKSVRYISDGFVMHWWVVWDCEAPQKPFELEADCKKVI